jgi:multiple sugar transport system permease protein
MCRLFGNPWLRVAPRLINCDASAGDLLIPLILNNRAEFMTLPVVIASLVSDLFVFHNLMMAICLVALAPSVILMLLLRRFVVEGLSAGALRG